MSGGSLLKKASAPHDYSLDYLTFVALEDGKFQLSTNNVYYSLDNGNTWVTLSADTASPTVSAGNKIMWKGKLTPVSSDGIGTFSSTGRFEACGNIMSLLFKDSFIGKTDLTGKGYAFYKLFYNNTKLENVENLCLPAMTLSQNCYGYMCHGCNLITTAPLLPAETLVSNCYYRMFYNCSKLNYIKVKCTTKPSTTYSNAWLYRVAASGTFVKTGSWSVSYSTSCVPTNWTVVQAFKI